MRALLLGHSSGGCLALEAASALGDRVAKVAVYEAPWNDDPAAQKAWGDYLRALSEALADGRRGDAVALFMQYVGTPPEQVAAVHEAPFWPSFEAIAPTLAYDHSEIMGPTAGVPMKQLAKVEVPVLTICGATRVRRSCAPRRRPSVGRSSTASFAPWRARLMRGAAGRHRTRPDRVLQRRGAGRRGRLSQGRCLRYDDGSAA